MCSICVQAVQARHGVVILKQPDGSEFPAYLKGDEHVKLVTTTDGYAIKQDKEGYWCYAWFDANGLCRCTPERVETGRVPSAISRNIPYDQLARRSIRKREAEIKECDNLAHRMARRYGHVSGNISRTGQEADTKAGEEQIIHKHGIVILAQFQDMKFTYDRENFIDLLTRKGYCEGGATGCAKEYFEQQFGNGWEFDFDVSPVITVSENRAWYGANNEDDEDLRPEKLIEEACILADSQIDFSHYDDDHDGEVDNIFLFYAGADEADGSEQDCIWSHAWYLYSGARIDLVLDGVRLNRYACSSELSRHSDFKWYFAGIGTFCHEYSHTFGLPDLYDTDYFGDDNLQSAAMWGSTSLMDNGNSNNDGHTPPFYNAIEREILGLGQIMSLPSGSVTLNPVGKDGIIYRMESDKEDEYYLLECRKAEGWDKYIGGDGMLIYHVDKSLNNSGRSTTTGREITARTRWTDNYNEVNANPSHQCADLIEADGRVDRVRDRSRFNDIYGIFFPSGTNTSFSPTSNPAFKFWSGADSPVAISDIRRSDGNVSMIVRELSGDAAPKAVLGKQSIFQDAAILSWSSDDGSARPSYIAWGRSDDVKEEVEVPEYATGEYCITFEKLDPRTSYSCEIYFKKDGVPGEKISCNFTTKSVSDGYPYINFKGLDRTEENGFPAGTAFPLRVSNAIGAEKVNWTFNGRRITTGKDGYWYSNASGNLTAEIIWEDGSRSYVSKEVKIR